MFAREWVSSLRAGLRERRYFGDVEAFAMFVGYPRSGHTLIGALLNAHPEAVIAHELDALAFVAKGFSRDQLYALILDQDRRLKARGGKVRGSNYRVEGQWQGRARRIRVIGDKKGSETTTHLRDDPDLLDRLRSRVGVPIRMLHVTRNPFDNIASMRRMQDRRGDRRPLERWVRRYFNLANAVAELERQVKPEEWLNVRHEDFVAEPRATLTRLCEFLGLEPYDDYLHDCAAIVNAEPRASGRRESWPPELIEEIRSQAEGIPFLAAYAREGPMHARSLA